MDPFEQAVADMRDAQKAYFQTRERTALYRSKGCERRVDEMLARRRQERQQPSLLKEERP